MSSFEFSHSGCTWCHPGGGPLEYDRDGYRYDGRAGGLVSGLTNPDRKPGDYFAFDPGTKSLVDRSAAWVSGGVSEIDCYMCHLVTPATPTTLNPDYRILERNYGDGSPATTAPMARASYGLANTGLLENVTLGQPTVNPGVTSFVWSSAFDSATVPGADVTTSSSNQGPPTKESCAQCHFPDKGNTTVALLPKGPAGSPLGFTTWQKHMAIGTVDDGDYVAPGTRNTVAWNAAKGRAEGGKRGESINDPLNPDVHMDRGMKCWDCHYLLGREATKSEIIGDGIGNDDGVCNGGEACFAELEADPLGKHTYPALLDAGGGVVQPAVEVWKIDHQFAKGDNAPDGKNMDQLDNTVTCQSCHTTRTHPHLVENGGNLTAPAPNHAGFPAFHFSKISCKTCHIPYLNGPVEQVLADFTVGPYRTFERSQVNSQGATGVGQRPLYLQRVTEHGTGPVEIQPFGLLSVALWANAVTQVGDECGQIAPTFQRLGKGAAEALRAAYGSTDGVTYDWKLNDLQNGDTSLIVNTPQEITDMVGQLITASGNPALRPVMNFYFNQFSVSHNVRPKAASSNKILGSAAGGGCVMCHSSSDPSSRNYTSYSVGFFDKSVLLFNQPNDGGKGLVQTTITDAAGTLERINIKFPYRKADGTSASVNLSNANGQTVLNTVDQGTVLGYTADQLATLKSPGTAGVETPTASFTVKADPVVSRKMNFDAASSVCRPSTTACTYTWDFGGAGTADMTDILRPSYVYDAAGVYPVKLTVSNGVTQSVYTADVTARNVNLKPVVDYTMNVAGMTATFVDSSTDDDQPLRVKVIWGNGTASSGAGGETFTKTYKYAGKYTINYTVTDATGAKASRSELVVVPQ